MISLVKQVEIIIRNGGPKRIGINNRIGMALIRCMDQLIGKELTDAGNTALKKAPVVNERRMVNLIGKNIFYINNPGAWIKSADYRAVIVHMQSQNTVGILGTAFYKLIEPGFDCWLHHTRLRV